MHLNTMVMPGKTAAHTHTTATVICRKHMCRVDQNRISAPYMTVCMVVSLLKIPYVHRIYL